MSRKIITVFGATGAQGGGLARAILAHPDAGFSLRAVTRKPDGEAGRKLAAAGAEVVAADMDDAASVERAMTGAHAAFCVTNFWEHFSPDRELAQALAMAEGAKRAGVAHVVWSTLEDTRRAFAPGSGRMPMLMGKYNVPHFDAKGEADTFFTERVPVTLLATSFYWDNLVHFGMGPKPGPDGTLTFALPMGKARLPGIAAEDIGRCAFGIFRDGSTWVGRTVGIAGGMPTGAEMAASLARALGKPVKYYAMPAADYRALGFPGAEDLGNMFQFYDEFEAEFCAARSVEVSRQLNPQLLDFDAWCRANAARIPTT